MTVEVGEDTLVLCVVEREDAAVCRHPPSPLCPPLSMLISQRPRGVTEDLRLGKCVCQSERVGWFGVVTLPFIPKILHGPQGVLWVLSSQDPSEGEV